MPPEPDISVVIPVRNGAGTIPALLQSLAAQTLPAERFEVIVVDNGSSDSTARVAEQAGARVVSDPAPNRARARNRGVAAARASQIAFTDADCVAAPGWLEGLLDRDSDAALVAGEVVVTTRPQPSALERFERLWRFGQASWVLQGWAATANLAVARTAFDAVGGFDPAYRHIAEDADFCIRAGRMGFGLGFCPDAVVMHDADRELREFLRRGFRHGYSSNQAYYRLGIGHRAWRDPLPVVSGKRALAFHGQRPDGMSPAEYRRMAAFACLNYAARMAGSIWAEAKRSR
jgi:GT2 family glycosyltransferase